MTATECSCGQPVKSTVLCARCVKTLTKALDNVPDYYADLETLHTRQTRYGTGSGGRSVGKAMPLPIDVRFASDGVGTEAEKLTRQITAAWSARVSREQRPLTGPTCDGPCLHRTCGEIRRRKLPRLTVRGCSDYLRANVRYIATRDYADDLLAVFLDLEKRLRRLVDRPAERYYAGVCGSETDLLDDADQVVDTTRCDRELYALPGSPSVKCPTCGCEYDVAARRDTLLAEAEDRLATVEAIVRIVTTLGDVKVDSSKISARVRKWAERGKLTAHGKRVIDGRERPTYRVGDVLDLLADDTRKATA